MTQFSIQWILSLNHLSQNRGQVHNDTGSPPTKTATTNGHWVRTTLDGFGRTIKTETGDGTSTKSVVDTVYDSCGCSPIGKMKQVSQPHLPNATPIYTTYAYDGLGRTTSVVAPDGSTTTYAYIGNYVKVTDPTGKWKQYYRDGLGNLTYVAEPDPALGTVWTQYVYDVLNHLTQVIMTRGSNTQYRTFNYTNGTTVGALLLSATNPENGTVTYTYNSNNLLATKTDAKGQQLIYAYDGYNRLSTVSLGPSLLRTYYYDTNPFDATFSQYVAGRLAAVQYGTPSLPTHPYIEMYSYNRAGQLTGKRFRLTRDVGYGSGVCQTQTLTADLNASYLYDNVCVS